MKYLIIVSFIWAFSFGLVGNTLKGVEPTLIATLRLMIAALVFIPFLKWKKLRCANSLQLIGLGSIQFGLMYISYIKAFNYIPSHLVALFSILTPVYVLAINNLWERRWDVRFVLPAAISIIGAGIIRAKGATTETLWTGFALMQIAGLSFAFGQVTYKNWKRQRPELKDEDVFAYMYVGGFVTALLAFLLSGSGLGIELNKKQIFTILYLGLIASGLGFFLWNKGASLANAGTLAVCNNLVVPLAMAVSLFYFGEIRELEPTQVIRLIAGSVLIASALYLSEKISKRRTIG